MEWFKEELYAGAVRQQLLTEESRPKYRFKVSAFSGWKQLPDAALEPLGGRAAAKRVRKKLMASRKAEEEAMAAANGATNGEGAAPPSVGTKRGLDELQAGDAAPPE